MKHLFRKGDCGRHLPARRRRKAALTHHLLFDSDEKSFRRQRLSSENAALLAKAECAFQEFRYYDDQVSVTQARNAKKNLSSVSLRALEKRHTVSERRVQRALKRLGSNKKSWQRDDWRAISVMRSALADDNSDDSDSSSKVNCDYDPEALATNEGVEALEDRIYACFGREADDIPFGRKKDDRLTILDLLPLTEDLGMRKKLFMALHRVWQAVNGDNSPSSPYRTLVRHCAKTWKPGNSPLDQIAREARLDLHTVESWIISALEKWRTVGPQNPVEPWDYAYDTSKATRELSKKITSRHRLEELRDHYYRALLAVDPNAHGIHFDLAPREDKDPVAYTTFGARNHRDGDRWIQGEFWVFASYATGNLDNLYELIHETGHSIHIAAIRTRPAFEDFPDSDAFTEALADMTGLEVYEPAWQKRFLGLEAPLALSLQDKYSSLVMDLAWGLFEIQMYRSPESDPNQVWTDITQTYLNIKPHPELSWWAVRGQLINSPGYMLTYALGDFMSAALRARTKALRGNAVFWDPPADVYGWLSERLYQFGLEQSAMDVLEEYLGGALRPEPLLQDLLRAHP